MFCHGAEEKFLGKPSGHLPIGQPIYEPAIAGRKPEIAGQWFVTNYNLEPDDVIKLCVSKKLTWNSLIKQAHIYLRMRQQAAFRSVRIPLLAKANSSRAEAQLQGRFDILTVEEAQTEAGIIPNPNYIHMHAEYNRNPLFRIDELEPEERPRVRVTTSILTNEEGDGVRVLSKRRSRRVTI